MDSDIVPFGKYKGRPVEEMLADPSYMAWLESQPWFREKFAHLSRSATDETQSTPEHNRLQAMFVDDIYAIALANVANLWNHFIGCKDKSEAISILGKVPQDKRSKVQELI